MFGSTVLEIALGLCLYYIALSLICSGVTQYFSQWRAGRGRILVDILGELVNHRQDSTILRALLSDARIAGGPIPPATPASESTSSLTPSDVRPPGAPAPVPVPAKKTGKLPLPAGGRIGEAVFAETVLDLITRRLIGGSVKADGAAAADPGEVDPTSALVGRLGAAVASIRTGVNLSLSGMDLARWDAVLKDVQSQVSGLSGKPLDEVHKSAEGILNQLRFAAGVDAHPGASATLAGAIGREAEEVLGLGRRLSAAQALKAVARDMAASPFQAFLLRLANRGSLEPDEIKQAIQDWYKSVNDRVSIEFRGKTQKVLFVTALGMTLLLNADTLQFVNRLAQDSALRKSVADAASSIAVEKSKPVAPAAPGAAPNMASAAVPADAAQAEIERLNIPLKWTEADWDQLKGIISVHDSGKLAGGVYKALGLIVTALALTMGAEFWYNLLKQIITIRQDKPKDEKAPGSG